MITLTLQSSPRPLCEQLNSLRTYFKLLRRKKLWKHTQDYGYAVVEVTHNAKTRHWHPHIHVLANGRFIKQHELSLLWKTITHGSKIVDVRAVSARKPLGDYLTKYLTKDPPNDAIDCPERAREWYKALTNSKWLIRWGRWPCKAPSEPKQPGDWRVLGSLASYIAAARSGNDHAIAVLAELDRTTLEIDTNDQHENHHPP